MPSPEAARQTEFVRRLIALIEGMGERLTPEQRAEAIGYAQNAEWELAMEYVPKELTEADAQEAAAIEREIKHFAHMSLWQQLRIWWFILRQR